MTTPACCLCAYEKLYRKGKEIPSRVGRPREYFPEVLLVVNPKCPIHGKLIETAKPCL